ncbi:hypothetical protein D9619_011499 [Psilocybe cf. subviscida]|uniref:Uncharacterized protein n=1 Tax=Psilocybe cf. subviscida TaxID=2480587 RepID=A0A8H5F9K3_9AGAR|nr:hypothetical protein D9619_011499 [Psilocybe cf. subviscida]
MASPPQAPSSQSGTRVLSDVVDQVLRFVQQPSSNLKNPKFGSAKDLDTNLNSRFGSGSTLSRNVNYPPTPSSDAERGHEHEASPLSPSRTLVASGSSNSASSTPRSRYKPLKRTESSESTSSSASRSTVTQNRDTEERKGKGTEKGQQGKRLNVSDRLRRLGRKMQSQKSSLSSPKVSAGQLADDSENDQRPSSTIYTPATPTRSYPATREQPTSKSLENGKGKERQLRAPTAHAKLLSMVAEADEPSSNVPSSSSSRFSTSEATTPTVVQTPATPTKSLAPSPSNDDEQCRNDPPEPMTLAARIQALIAGLPFPSLSATGITTGNNLPPSSEPPSIPAASPAVPYSPDFSAFSAPLSNSPSPLPAHNYDDFNVETDAQGRPIPPPYASPLPPRERMILEEFLSSPVIMNGELPTEESETDARSAAYNDKPEAPRQGKEKPIPAPKVMRSIWSVLESMGTSMSKGQASSEPAPPASVDTPTPPPVPQRGDTNTNENESMYSDTGSSVMIYSPLIPNGAQDLPELAEAVLVVSGYPTFEVDKERAGPSTTATDAAGAVVTPPSGPNPADASSWIPSSVRQWSLVQAISTWSTTTPASSGVNTDDGSSTVAPPSTSISTTSAATPGNNQPPSGPGPTNPAVRKAWVPSTTKMSVQAMWWGYRLYLPPPVMAILSDRTLEASKRAALITSALTWFFANLPITALPPPLQPAALLLQRIAPFLGYIGAFISWSWGVIEGYDVGYGVTLTATWLLPMALIPGTWHKDEFPMSPSALGQPVPLPQILYSPAPASHRALEPVQMIQTPAGPVPARVTEFLPLPTPTSTTANSQLAPTSTSNSTPVAAAISLPSSPAPSYAADSSFPPAAGQPSPLLTPTPTPPTPVAPSRTPRPWREVELAPSTPQSMRKNIDSAMSSPTLTPSSHYQTPLLSSPAPTSSSRYHTPLWSPHVPLSPRLPSSTYSTSLTYATMPIPEPIPSTPAIPLSLLQPQMFTPIHPPPSPALHHSPPPSSQRSRSQPHSKPKSTTSTHATAPAPPVPPVTVQATQRPPGPTHKSRVSVSSRSQNRTESGSSSQLSPTPSGMPLPTHNTNPRTTVSRITGHTQTSTTTSAAHSHSHPDAAPVPVSVPIGSQLEQHLLSGPLMSPIALPDVDLPDSSASATLPMSPPVPTGTLAAAPVPVYAYSNKEERKRERDRDKARLRERARAIFRRTDSNEAGAQKAKA